MQRFTVCHPFAHLVERARVLFGRRPNSPVQCGLLGPDAPALTLNCVEDFLAVNRHVLGGFDAEPDGIALDFDDGDRDVAADDDSFIPLSA